MAYVDVMIAVLGAVLLAVVMDQLTGRRGLIAALTVSGVGAACGWFLAVRVFGVATTGQWPWVLWAMAASILGLVAYFILRNTR